MLTTKRSLVTLKLPYARWHRVRPPASQVRQRLTSLPSRVNRCRSTRLKATVSFPGSINTEPVVRIQVRKPAEDTLIARVVRLAEEAADAKAPSERFIERFARWYMPVICALVVAVTVLPPLLWQEPWGTWIYRSLTLLLIGCPCALVISTPAAVAAALAAGARRGLLVKGGQGARGDRQGEAHRVRHEGNADRRKAGDHGCGSTRHGHGGGCSSPWGGGRVWLVTSAGSGNRQRGKGKEPDLRAYDLIGAAGERDCRPGRRPYRYSVSAVYAL